MNILNKDNNGSGNSLLSFSSVLLTLILTVPVSVEAMGLSGGLDKTFGDRGVVLFQSGGAANDSTLQTDGKIVSSASSPERLVRHHTDGSLDTLFGNGSGYVTAADKAVAIQPDGMLIAADEVSVGYPRFAFRVQRFYPDGSIDVTFGSNGTAIAEFESTLEPTNIHGYDVTASDVIVQDDGKILVAGTYNYYHYDGFSYSRRPIAQALARFNSNGMLDSGFGTLGTLVNDNITAAEPGENPRESVSAAVLQTDGRILVGGYLENSDLDIMVTRYNIDGTPDSGFGVNGVATVDLGSVETGRDISIQSDGSIIVVGRSEQNGFFSADIALLRLLSNGELDSGFGVGGVTITDYDGHQDGANSVAIQADGKIIIGGFVTESLKSGSTRTLIGVARYNSDGTLDNAFGHNGFAADVEGIANDILIQQDRKIIASGSALLRYLP